MHKIKIFSSIVLLAFISSCTKDKAEDSNPCAYETTELKYNGLIKNIINSNCANSTACHGSPQGQNAGGNLTSYALVKEKINNDAFNNRVFVLKDMPQGSSLSECDLKKLKAWYDAGSPE
ncbi:MAG: hypothetical protein NTV09_11185 [Bacteroidetes bacterium]|nr:hypothetical protein [Bacteroidota bacterium]